MREGALEPCRQCHTQTASQRSKGSMPGQNIVFMTVQARTMAPNNVVIGDRRSKGRFADYRSLTPGNRGCFPSTTTVTLSGFINWHIPFGILCKRAFIGDEPHIGSIGRPDVSLRNEKTLFGVEARGVEHQKRRVSRIALCIITHLSGRPSIMLIDVRQMRMDNTQYLSLWAYRVRNVLEHDVLAVEEN